MTEPLYPAGTANTASDITTIVPDTRLQMPATAVAATATSFEEARVRAYRAVDFIDWPGGFCRRDIGWRAAARRDS